jgi:hypothetical protein
MTDHAGDPRIPPRDRCVLRYLLDRVAGETPDKIFVQFDGGEAKASTSSLGCLMGRTRC